MALPRPSLFLDWTDGGATKVVNPPAGQKSTGWVANQKGPFRFWNWLFYTTDLWLKYFDSVSYAGQSTVTAGTTADGLTRTYFCNPSGGAFNFTLPLASNFGGYRVTTKNTAALGGNNVTVIRSGSDTIEDETSYVLAPKDTMTWEADAANNTWRLVG